jgi:hypothetical protein
VSDTPKPIVLELAPLPREQIGPFLLLGLDKAAGDDEVEAHWARRLIWARKNQLAVGLEDIHWARETLRDADRRVQADLTSLNPDTIAGTLHRLEGQYPDDAGREPPWQPLDLEKQLADYTPPAEVPDAGEFLASLAVPELPGDVPAVARLLEQFVQAPIDPWALDVPSPSHENEPHE